MKAHVERGMVEGEEAEIGRDPRQMTSAELGVLGHYKRPLLDAVRQNCIECCCGSQAEVRRCRMVACAMWPYRMGTNPFTTRTMSEEQREAAVERLAAARAARATKG